VNELLTFEKLAAGLYRLELAPAAIFSFVREMVEEFYIPAHAKEIALEIISGTLYHYPRFIIKINNYRYFHRLILSLLL
jgi:hypothetical protein